MATIVKHGKTSKHLGLREFCQNYDKEQQASTEKTAENLPNFSASGTEKTEKSDKKAGDK